MSHRRNNELGNQKPMPEENFSTSAALDVSVSPKSVSNSPPGVLVLEENNDLRPSEEEILMYATSIGIDTKKEPELIYLAREGISAPLPEGWSAIQDKDNNIFFHESSTGRTTQDHPMDALYRKLVTEARKSKKINISTTDSTTVVAEAKPPSTPKPQCNPTECQRVPESSKSVAVEAENKPPLASLEPASEDPPTTYQALPSPKMRRPVQTSTGSSLFRTPIDRAPERRVKPSPLLHHNFSPLPTHDSPRLSLDKTALVTAERRLSALQAHVHGLKASSTTTITNAATAALNPEFLTPADRWFWPSARTPKSSPGPSTKDPQQQPAAKTTTTTTTGGADEMPHLETSPSSQHRRKSPARVLGEINNYLDQPTGGGAGMSVGRARQPKQVASDSDRENRGSRRARIQEEEEEEEEEEDGDEGYAREALDLHFSRALRLSDRAPPARLNALSSSGQFERHRQSGVAGLYSLYSPPGSSGKKGRARSGVACESSYASCSAATATATHSNYPPPQSDERQSAAQLPSCFLPSPTTSPTAFDANLGLRCMMDERARLQRKMTCLKLTYKAYKMKLAEMDSGLRMLYSAASSASVSGVPPSGCSPRASGRDHSLSVRHRPANDEDCSNLSSSESSVGGMAPSSAHRRSFSRYPAGATAMHQSDLFIDTLTGRPLVTNRLYRQSEFTRLQTPEPLPRYRRSISTHSASRGL